MSGRLKAYRTGVILSIVGLVAVCGAASVPIVDGIATWSEYGTPDTLGLGIGAVIILLFGVPIAAVLQFCRTQLRRPETPSPEKRRGDVP